MMRYITRESIIDSILNEDVAISGEIPARRRSIFAHDTNEREDGKDKSKKASKGGISKKSIKDGLLIFRKPTSSELKNMENKFDVNVNGDYQTAQIAILSMLLFDFGLINRSYNTKKADWNEGKTNAASVDKILKRLDQIFHATKLSPSDPVEKIGEIIDNSTDELEKRYGVRIPEIIGAFDKWPDIMRHDSNFKSPEFPTGFNPILMKNIQAVAGDAHKVEIYNELTELFREAMLKPEFSSPKKYAKWIEKNQTASAVLREPIIKKYVNEALSTNIVSDIEDFVAYLRKKLTDSRVESKMGHTNTVMTHKAIDSLKYFDLKMKRAGFEQGVADFKETMEYLEEKDPGTFSHVCRKYGINPNELKSFNSYKDFCDYLFADPDKLMDVYRMTGYEEKGRARTKGDIRKGAALAVNYRSLKKKEEALKQKLDDGNNQSRRGPRGKTKEEALEEIQKLEATIKELEGELNIVIDELKERGLTKRAEWKQDEEYNKLKDVIFKAKKTLSMKNHLFGKMTNKSGTRRTLEDEIDDIRSRREAIVNKEHDKIKDAAQLAHFQDKYGVEKTRREMGDFDIGAGYVKMSFTFALNSRNDTEIADYIVDNHLEQLNKEEQKNGEEGTINFAWEPGVYEKGLHTYPCTQIIVDYGKSTHLYKTMKAADKQQKINIVSHIINDVIQAVANRFGKRLDLVTGDPKWKIQMMAKSDLSYSFND